MLVTVWRLHVLLWEARWCARACLLIVYSFVLLCCVLLLFRSLLMLTFYYNIHLILHLSFCWTVCCYIPANCSHKSRSDSGPGPSRGVVKFSCAYSRSSSLIPFSPSGLRNSRVQVTMIVQSFTKLINASYDYFHIRKDYCILAGSMECK